jgi:hypothetical protein
MRVKKEVSPMQRQLTPEQAIAQEFTDKLWNLATEYYATWRTLPKYLYVNKTQFEEEMVGLILDIEALQLEVVPTEMMPYGRIVLHHDYQDRRDVALWHRQFTDEEGEESGKLVIV